MFGLPRSVVRLAAHHTEWHTLFQDEKDRLVEKLKDFDITIEHIGSTAIPFVPAKPIIDIALAIDQEIEFSTLRNVLNDLGYEERGPQGVDDRILWILGTENDRKFYLHLTHKGSKTWNDCLAFRAALRSTTSLREEYAKLKKELAVKYPENRKSYTKGKHEFIERVVHQYQSSQMQFSNESVTNQIVSDLRRHQNILLVGRRDAGKTHFVTHTLIPLLQKKGLDVRYFKDMDEEIQTPPEDAVVIFDEFEILDDKEFLERMHPEEQPYYSDSYLRKVHFWLQKAENVPNRRIYVLSRNEEDIGNIANRTLFDFDPNVMPIHIAPWKTGNLPGEKKSN
ncbi:hypothetical protein AUJ46_04980 [Candidatus Peregrinibacteria bacterium CG1_02_54_53]|nr:MAG: hypothetical protein AUJ46_04980 [Candidatus Peregrinibacteria bacterium CG1_02_54_53]